MNKTREWDYTTFPKGFISILEECGNWVMKKQKLANKGL